MLACPALPNTSGGNADWINKANALTTLETALLFIFIRVTPARLCTRDSIPIELLALETIGSLQGLRSNHAKTTGIPAQQLTTARQLTIAERRHGSPASSRKRNKQKVMYPP